MQPENGGMSVFAHEYTHDLGLPDLYDTGTGGENSVNYWSLMAQSRETAPERPVDRQPRLRPGRLGQAAARLARLRDGAALAEPDASPSARTSTTPTRPQAAVVVLPKKQVTTKLVDAVRRHEVVVERHR